MSSALRSLLERAARLPVDATEITDSDRVRYVVRREGHASSIRLDPASPTTDDRSIVWTRAVVPPEFYPNDVPFIPGVDAVLVITATGQSCTWSAAERDAHARERVGNGLDALLALRPSDGLMSELHEIWIAAVEQSISAGWTTTDEASSDFPFPIRTTVLEHDGRRRKIDRGGVMGLPVVTLNDTDVP